MENLRVINGTTRYTVQKLHHIKFDYFCVAYQNQYVLMWHVVATAHADFFVFKYKNGTIRKLSQRRSNIIFIYVEYVFLSFRATWKTGFPILATYEYVLVVPARVQFTIQRNTSRAEGVFSFWFNTRKTAYGKFLRVDIDWKVPMEPFSKSLPYTT